MTRALYLVLGLGFTGLGIAGAFLPLLPTTVFLILAAGCFARSSPRLEAWILGHRRFGPLVRAWRENGAIPRKAKIARDFVPAYEAVNMALAERLADLAD